MLSVVVARIKAFLNGVLKQFNNSQISHDTALENSKATADAWIKATETVYKFNALAFVEAYINTKSQLLGVALNQQIEKTITDYLMREYNNGATSVILTTTLVQNLINNSVSFKKDFMTVTTFARVIL